MTPEKVIEAAALLETQEALRGLLETPAQPLTGVGEISLVRNVSENGSA